jgi:urease alpha subunit
VRTVTGSCSPSWLAGEVQAVAGFDFHGGHAVLEQLLQTALGAGEQLFFTGGPGGPHGAGDATARRCDFCVADALQTLLEFTAAIAAEHRVGVAVDQAGCDPGAIQIHGFDVALIR